MLIYPFRIFSNSIGLNHILQEEFSIFCILRGCSIKTPRPFRKAGFHCQCNLFFYNRSGMLPGLPEEKLPVFIYHILNMFQILVC